MPGSYFVRLKTVSGAVYGKLTWLKTIVVLENKHESMRLLWTLIRDFKKNTFAISVQYIFWIKNSRTSGNKFCELEH